MKLVCTSEYPLQSFAQGVPRGRSITSGPICEYRRCFTLCITKKLNLELRSDTNATTVAVATITEERGRRVGGKKVFASFFG